MTTADARAIASPEALARFSHELQQLRLDAGAVSFGEIARRIVERRLSEGAAPAASRVARSTVFDVFQPGRRRMNAELVREVVLALGLSAQEADAWRQRCVAAQVARPAPAAPGPSSGAAHPAAALPAREAMPPAWHRIVIAVLLIGCVGVNLFGTTFVLRTGAPIFLDMIGTATAAFALGPWFGTAVGAATNLFGMVSSTPETVVFALVNVAGAVVWGYGARRFARDIPRFVLLNVAVALTCTLVAVPLNVALYGAASPNASSSFVPLLADQGMLSAIFSVNLAASVVDKLIAGFVALGIARLLLPLRLSEPPILLLAPRPRR